ncbi:hypothetical protein NXX91_15385 [Bacteroides thetaiotaomicron]|nr:hypothetical protein [Bacteroides thetaiotaomicron]
MDNKFEKENIMDANNNMQETQIKPSNENIHGWLSFFLFCIGLRGLLTLSIYWQLSKSKIIVLITYY